MRKIIGALSVAAGAAMALAPMASSASAATAPAPGWTIQASPSLVLPDGDIASLQFTGISCASARNCTATGGYSDPEGNAAGTFTEHWNGRRWTIQSTTPTSNEIRSPAARKLPTPPGGPWVVACVPGRFRHHRPSNCTAVGTATDESTGNQFTVAEHWNGRTWTSEVMPSVPAIAVNLGGISCPSARHCFFVGSYYSGGAAPFFFPLTEQWNGRG
jgi:hypothetical protein